MNMRFLFILSTISLLLILRFTLFFLFQPQLHEGQVVTFQTILLSEPQNSSSRNSLTANYSNIFGSEKIQVYYSPQISLKYGDEIKISGKLINRLLNNKKPVLAIYFPKIEAVRNNANIVLAAAYFFRQKTKELYSQTLSQTDSDLLLGIVLGIRGEFSKSFIQNLRATGVMHVISASGMNVSMTSAFLFAILAPFFRRQITIVLTALMVIFYMIVSGLQSSILRAGIMAICAFSAQLAGRQHTGLYGLGIAVAVMLLWDPTIIFDIGFQLSALSTMGILILKPLLPSQHALDDITTTTSAQIFTLPIMLANFGTYGIYSIIVNALVLWTIAPLMILGGVGALVGFVFVPVGMSIIWITSPLLWFFESVINFFGNMGILLTMQSLPIPLVVGYYFILFSVIIILTKRLGVRTSCHLEP